MELKQSYCLVYIKLGKNSAISHKLIQKPRCIKKMQNGVYSEVEVGKMDWAKVGGEKYGR